ncbi:MAG TPA: PRC-barrel domain-containing protein [Nitrososphaera sp.]
MHDDKDPEHWIGCEVVDTNGNTLGIVENVDKTGNLLIIRGRIDSKEYSVPKNAVINVDKSSDKIVLYMTRDDFIKYAKV